VRVCEIGPNANPNANQSLPKIGHLFYGPYSTYSLKFMKVHPNLFSYSAIG